MHQAVRANVRASANQLRHGSEVLERLIEHDGLLVVGAEYSLESGLVDVFDGVPVGFQEPTSSGPKSAPRPEPAAPGAAIAPARAR